MEEKMKKITCLIVLMLSFTMLFSVSRKQAKEAMDKWMIIVSEKDLNVKLIKTEELYVEYGDQNDRMTQLIYSSLVDTAYQLAKYEKVIEYGEKALKALPNMEDLEKFKVFLSLANSYYVTKTDMKKAYDYTNALIELAKPFQEKFKESRSDMLYIAPALRLQAKMLFVTPGKMLESFDKALEAFTTDQSKVSADLVLLLANEAVKQDRIDEALVVYEKFFKLQSSAELAKIIGYIYGRKGDDVKTTEFLLASYQLQKSADVAYNLGILYNKIQDVDNAIKYFSESFVLYEKAGNMENMEKARNTLGHLYMNVKMKESTATQKEKEKGYEDILAIARLSVEGKNQ
jgi:tetratricopeptide (TPR) repeat protein